jgi:hypothetical protein
MIMSILSTESNRVSAVEKSTVATAVSEAQAAGTQATQQAEAVAGSLTSQSIAASLTSAGGSGLPSAMITNQSQTSMFALSNQSQSNGPSSFVLRATQSMQVTESVALYSAQGAGVSASYSLQAPSKGAAEPDAPQNESVKFGGRSVLNDSLEARTFLQQTAQEQRTETVNKSAQPNELAGGVDIASMAKHPAGYQNYSFTLTDAQFYAPKEIYKNQNNVDNARALRQLSSDQLHQQLIQQQYRR